MSGSLAMCLLVLAVVLFVAGLVFARLGGGARVLTPIMVFLLIDLAATWPAMLPTDGSVLLNEDGTIAILVSVGVLVAIVAYGLGGGLGADETRWRREGAVSTREVREVGLGLAALVSVLSVLSIYRFGGLPPMLRGGFRSLLDPVGNAEQVSLIREGRRTLTKGSVLLGESYQGQGLMNSFSEAGWMVAVAGAVLFWSWRRTKGSMAAMGLVLALMFVFQGSTGQRAPLIFALLCGVAALTLRLRLRNEAILAGMAVLIGFLLLIMPLAKGERAGTDVASRVEAAWTRVVDGNGRNSAHIVNLVDTGQLQYSHGSLFAERSLAVLPGVADQDPFAYRLSGMINGTGKNKTGYLTPTQFGLMYAEGGTPAVLLGYGLTGFLIGLAWRVMTRLRGAAGPLIAAVGTVVLGKMAITGAPGMVAMLGVSVFAVALVMLPTGLRVLVGRAETSEAVQPGTGVVGR